MKSPSLLVLLLSLAGSVWAQTTALPSADDPAVKAHLQKKADLIAKEKVQRQDHEFRSSMSPTALKAEAIVAAIRQEEIDQYWRRPGTLGHEDDERFAGMMFPKARPLIPATRLWKIVSRMPKGALLHAHFPALVPFGSIFAAILDTEGMMVTSSQVVDDDLSARNATIAFSHVNGTVANVAPANVSISSTDYVAGQLVPVRQAADHFTSGRDAFLALLMSKVTLSAGESVRHDLGVDAVWRDFQASFFPAAGSLQYEPILRASYQTLFRGLVDDGVNWLEIRTGGSSVVSEGDAAASTDPDIFFRILVEEVDKFQAGADGGKDLWGVKVIWSDLRSEDRSTLIGTMRSALARKQRFPDLISGYDLVGQEDLGRSLSDLSPELLWFQAEAGRLNLTLPFFFHAGETLGDGNSTDSNLFDAMLMDSRRIGHGFSMYKHPLLMQMARSERVMLEVCPISEEVLRLSTDILHHPLPAMIAHGVATSISNDDAAILGQDAVGLSYDFFQTIQGFDNIGLGGLGALAENSVRWANFEDQSRDDWLRDIDLGVNGTSIKAQRLLEWHDKWETYCEWIVDEYKASAGETDALRGAEGGGEIMTETYVSGAAAGADTGAYLAERPLETLVGWLFIMSGLVLFSVWWGR